MRHESGSVNWAARKIEDNFFPKVSQLIMVDIGLN